jgi:hypothetical protein
MALNHSPKIVTDGLVFAYDMANTQKSWKGAPAVNLITNPTNEVIATVNEFAVFQDLSPIFDAQGPGTYSISADIKTSIPGNITVYTASGSVEYDIGYYVANCETYYKRFFFNNINVTQTNPGVSISNLSFYGTYGTGVFPSIKNVQVEKNSFCTPFVNGTRSNTQALIDLIGNNTITTSSLTYASNGTFSFNGSSNFINLNNNIQSGYTSASYEFWCRTTSLPGSGSYFQLYIQENSTWIGLYNVGAGAFFGIDLNNGSGWFDNNGGSNTGAKTTATLSTNTDYHVAYSWNGSTVSVYLNGNLQATASTLQAANGRQNVTQLGAGTASRNIGSRYDGSSANWIGTINSVRFYNRALTTTEVLNNFNAHRGRYGI